MHKNRNLNQKFRNRNRTGKMNQNQIKIKLKYFIVRLASVPQHRKAFQKFYERLAREHELKLEKCEFSYCLVRGRKILAWSVTYSLIIENVNLWSVSFEGSDWMVWTSILTSNEPVQGWKRFPLISCWWGFYAEIWGKTVEDVLEVPVYPHNGKGVGEEGVDEAKNRVFIAKRRTNSVLSVYWRLI